MKKFLENLFGITIYAIILAFFLWIYNPNFPVRAYVGFGLIAGFFMGMFNEINRALINLRKS
jgi:glucose uptake protein GlcU